MRDAHTLPANTKNTRDATTGCHYSMPAFERGMNTAQSLYSGAKRIVFECCAKYGLVWGCLRDHFHKIGPTDSTTIFTPVALGWMPSG